MSAQTVIDSLEFARTAQQLEGLLPLGTLARLKDSLLDDDGEVRFEVQGARDARGRPMLRLQVSGVLHLQCQRCLGALDYELRIVNTLLLGSAEQEDPDEPDAEWIEAGGELDLAELVEDEIMLSLPYAPRHEEGQCRPADAKPGAGTASAFAKLAGLKRKTH